MPSALEEAIRLSVDHITNRAQHYFSIVRSKNQEGVLWFSFTYKEDGIEAAIRARRYITADAASSNGLLSIKRTAFLPLSAIVNTDAKPLLDMTSRCDHRQQFVAWFTIEPASGSSMHSSSSGNPQVSKVIIVDTLSSQHQQQAPPPPSQFMKPPPPQQQSSSATTTPRTNYSTINSHRHPSPSVSSQRTAGREASGESAVDDLRRDMQDTAAHLRHQQHDHGVNSSTRPLGGGVGLSGMRNASSPPSRGGNVASSRTVDFNLPDDEQQAIEREYPHNTGNTTPGPNSLYNARQAMLDAPSYGTNASDANYAHLLKVSLQISDSVAKLSARMDEMQAQFSLFEKDVNKQLYDVKMRCGRLDANVADVKPKIDDVTQGTIQFGSKLAHLRQETQAMFESLSKRITSVSDSVISNNLGLAPNSSTPRSGGGGGQQQQHQHRQSNDPTRLSQTHVAAAFAEADKVNFDSLIARHASSSQPGQQHNQHNGSQPGHHQALGIGSRPAGHDDSSSRKRDALDAFMSDLDPSQSFQSRKQTVEMREAGALGAQEIVDDYNTIRSDMHLSSTDQRITADNVHRQKATVELARQEAATRSEAQAIASNYMAERDRAMGEATGNTSLRGVPVMMEQAMDTSATNERFVVNDSEMNSAPQGAVAGAASMYETPMSKVGGGGGGAAESLADMIASMERRLE